MTESNLGKNPEKEALYLELLRKGDFEVTGGPLHSNEFNSEDDYLLWIVRMNEVSGTVFIPMYLGEAYLSISGIQIMLSDEDIEAIDKASNEYLFKVAKKSFEVNPQEYLSRMYFGIGADGEIEMITSLEKGSHVGYVKTYLSGKHESVPGWAEEDEVRNVISLDTKNMKSGIEKIARKMLFGALVKAFEVPKTLKDLKSLWRFAWRFLGWKAPFVMFGAWVKSVFSRLFKTSSN